MLITITRVEGPTHLCGKTVKANNFAHASAILAGWSWSAPEKGAYDKCDFAITDPDNGVEEYRGRFDLKHWRIDMPDLKAHVLGHLAFISGNGKPRHLNELQYMQAIGCFSPAQKNEAWHLHEVWKTLP
jgi:hypothetical protein